jgi:hypothetical protein
MGYTISDLRNNESWLLLLQRGRVWGTLEDGRQGGLLQHDAGPETVFCARLEQSNSARPTANYSDTHNIWVSD